MNYARDVVEKAPPEAPALIELNRRGERRAWTFGELAAASARLAGRFEAEGLRKGDVAMLWLGNTIEWVLAMVAGFRLGVVVVACPEQLRAKDLRGRLEVARPSLLVVDERHRDELAKAAPRCPVLWAPDEALWRAADPAAAVELSPADPCLLTFTSGTSGSPKAVLHLQRYLTGQALQAEHWLGVGRGDVVWCTAAAGWSKSARNSFVAPWLRGGVAVVRDGRFDPEERLEIVARERVNVLCMAPTEYRIIAKRTTIPRFEALRSCVAAGEALDPAPIDAWREATGVEIRDGYGQTETGQTTGFAPGERIRPGSMGRPLPGVRMWLEDGQLAVDPRTVPTFFHGYYGEAAASREATWLTGDRAERDDDGYFWFSGRADDIIVSSGYRIGPVEVESALGAHPAVEEAAVVASPDETRGAIVRAVVVLRADFAPSAELARALQDHVKAETAPYKYPRRVDFVESLPKTASGKVIRASLRE